MDLFGNGFGASPLASAHRVLQAWIAAWYYSVEQELTAQQGVKPSAQEVCDTLMGGADEVAFWPWEPDEPMASAVEVLLQAYGPERLTELVRSMTQLVCDQHGVSPGPTSITERALRGYGLDPSQAEDAVKEWLADYYDAIYEEHGDATPDVVCQDIRARWSQAVQDLERGDDYKRAFKLLFDTYGSGGYFDFVNRVIDSMCATGPSRATASQQSSTVEPLTWRDPSAPPREFPKQEHPDRPWRDWWYRGYGTPWPYPLPSHFVDVSVQGVGIISAWYSPRYGVAVSQEAGRQGKWCASWGLDDRGDTIEPYPVVPGSLCFDTWQELVRVVEQNVLEGQPVFALDAPGSAPAAPSSVEAVFWREPGAKPMELEKREHAEAPWREWWFKGYGGDWSPYLDSGVPIAPEADHDNQEALARSEYANFRLPIPLPNTFGWIQSLPDQCPLFHSDVLDMGLYIGIPGIRCAESLDQHMPPQFKLGYGWDAHEGLYEDTEAWIEDVGAVGRAILQRWKDHGYTDEQIAQRNHWPWKHEPRRAGAAAVPTRYPYVPWYEHPMPDRFHEVQRGSDSWPAWYNNELAFMIWINPDPPHLRPPATRENPQTHYRYHAMVPRRGMSMDELAKLAAYTDNWNDILEAIYTRHAATGSVLMGLQGLGAGDIVPGLYHEYDFWPEDQMQGTGLQGLKPGEDIGHDLDIDIDLRPYECIIISSSAGKDSQAMLTRVVELADAQSYPRDRIIVVHADLSHLVEWDGTLELARAQAEAYGLQFQVVSRVGQVKESGKEGEYKMGEKFTPIPDYAERKGMWPGVGQTQWCTSDFKTAPIRAFMTAVMDELRGGRSGRQVRILSCLGLRAQESKRRAIRPGFDVIRKHSLAWVDEWCPIKWWSVGQVWETIRRSGLPYHPAYDLGMRRLSCCFCIGASLNDLLIAGSANQEKLREYVRVEDAIGFTFQPNRSLRSVMEELDRRGWNVTSPSTAQNPVEDNEDINLLEGDSQPCDVWLWNEEQRAHIEAIVTRIRAQVGGCPVCGTPDLWPATKTDPATYQDIPVWYCSACGHMEHREELMDGEVPQGATPPEEE